MPRSEIDIPKSKEEKTKLIKEIVHREMKRKFASVNSTAATATSRKKQSLLIPKSQKLYIPVLPTAAGQTDLGVVKLTAYPETVATVSETSPPSKLSTSRIKFKESLSKFEETSKEPKRNSTRRKMTKEEAESKQQEHREMVRGLFGKLDFLVGGGLG